MTLNSPCCHQTAHNQVSAPSLGAWLIVTSNYPHYFVILRYVAMICVVLCHILASSLYLEFWDLTEDKYRGLHDFQVRKAHLRYGCFNMLFSKSYLFVNLGLKIRSKLARWRTWAFFEKPRQVASSCTIFWTFFDFMTNFFSGNTKSLTNLST